MSHLIKKVAHGALLMFGVASLGGAGGPTRLQAQVEDGTTPKAGPAETDLESLAAVSPGAPLSLAEALRAADGRNLSLAVARVELEKAQAKLDGAWARTLPSLGGQISFTHNDQADTFDPTAGLAPVFSKLGLPPPDSTDLIVRPQNNLMAMVRLGVPVVNAEAWSTIGVAELGSRVVELTLRNQRDRLLLAVSQAYWVAVVQRKLVGVQARQIHSAADHLEIARARLAAGDAVRIDVVRAQTLLEQARQDLLSAKLGLDNARDALGTLCGVGGLPLPAAPPTLSAPELSTEPEKLLGVLAKRPDLRAGQLGVQLAEKLLKRSWMRFVPTLSAGLQGSYLITDPPDLGSSDRSRWAFFFNLSVPIYSQLHYADLRGRRAELRQATAKVNQQESQAALQVRKAQRDYQASLAVSETAARQATLAKEALALTDAAYRNGVATSLEVSETQRTARNAEVNGVAQQLRSQMALLSLLNALGEDLLQAAEDAAAPETAKE